MDVKDEQKMNEDGIVSSAILDDKTVNKAFVEDVDNEDNVGVSLSSASFFSVATLS